MKLNHSFAITIFLTFFLGTKLFSQEVWSTRELMDPALLSNIISDKKSEKPVIFNIGPLADIKGAIHIGSTSDKKNLEKFKQALAKVPKEKYVVIYCGCCPFRNCPNVRPAFQLLKEMNYKNPRLLNLPQNLKVNWTDYGYPME